MPAEFGKTRFSASMGMMVDRKEAPLAGKTVPDGTGRGCACNPVASFALWKMGIALPAGTSPSWPGSGWRARESPVGAGTDDRNDEYRSRAGEAQHVSRRPRARP